MQVTLRKATEAVNLVLRRITPWKDEHQTPTTEDYQRLTALVLERINADMPEEDRENYTKKLLPVLRTLVSNPLNIAGIAAEEAVRGKAIHHRGHRAHRGKTR